MDDPFRVRPHACIVYAVKRPRATGRFDAQYNLVREDVLTYVSGGELYEQEAAWFREHGSVEQQEEQRARAEWERDGTAPLARGQRARARRPPGAARQTLASPAR